MPLPGLNSTTFCFSLPHTRRDADTLATPANLERLKRARPDATVVLVAGVGHELAYTVAAQAILVGWINGNIAARP